MPVSHKKLNTHIQSWCTVKWWWAPMQISSVQSHSQQVHKPRKGTRLKNCHVIWSDTKLISRRDQLAIVFTHDDFTGDDHVLLELHTTKLFCKIITEGPSVKILDIYIYYVLVNLARTLWANMLFSILWLSITNDPLWITQPQLPQFHPHTCHTNPQF